MKSNFGKTLLIAITTLITIIFGFSQTETKAQDTRPFPIPQFSGEMARDNAETLRATMNEMRQHLCDKPDPLTNNWQNKFDDILVNLIVNEYRLVWAKTTDLNAEEKRLYDQFFDEKRKISRLFARHLQTNPELKAAVEEYEKPNELFNKYKGRDGYGRAIFMIHSMLFFDKDYPATAQVSAQKMSDLEILGEYTAIRLRMIELLAQTHRLLHERGIAEVNQFIPQNSIFRFSIHLTPDRLKRRVLEELIRRFQLELGVPLVKESAITIYESDEWVKNALFVPTDFDNQQQDLLRDECSKKVDLNGTWISPKPGSCTRPGVTEVIRITHTGNRVVAVKVVGNPCVKAGEVTFRGDFTQNPFDGEIRTRNEDGSNDQLIKIRIFVKNQNTIEITKGSETFTLIRKMN